MARFHIDMPDIHEFLAAVHTWNSGNGNRFIISSDGRTYTFTTLANQCVSSQIHHLLNIRILKHFLLLKLHVTVCSLSSFCRASIKGLLHCHSSFCRRYEDEAAYLKEVQIQRFRLSNFQKFWKANLFFWDKSWIGKYESTCTWPWSLRCCKYIKSNSNCYWNR